MMVLQFFIWGAWLPLIFGYLPSLGFTPSQQSWILNAFPIAAIVGMFFGLVGIILGPFLGAVIGEVSGGSDWRSSGKAGIGAWLGMVFATAFKLSVSFLMIGIFLLQLGWGDPGSSPG